MPKDKLAFTARRIVASTLLAWLSMLGFDLLLHGGLLAGFYVVDDPFLLPPTEAFRLIPLGYASFLLNAILLVWLMTRLGVRTARDGAVLGVSIGAMIWGSWILALASITTARYTVLAGWFVGQTVEMSLAGAVVGAAFARDRLRAVVVFVLVFVIACFVVVVILQNTGLAPAQHSGAETWLRPSRDEPVPQVRYIQNVRSHGAREVETSDATKAAVVMAFLEQLEWQRLDGALSALPEGRLLLTGKRGKPYNSAA